MEIIYSPWRLSYVQEKKGDDTACVFCKALLQKPSPESLVLHSDPLAAVILNRYPYTNGHLLVLPREHVDSLTGLSPEGRARCVELLALCEDCLRRGYGCHGINAGLNLGEAAGAGITGHIHWHILPRWRGDTNFMTVLAETRVVPESLPGVYARLHQYFEGV